MPDDYILRSDAIAKMSELPFLDEELDVPYAEEVIMKIPAADVEPVRHGRWIINEINDDIRVLMCSCGFREKRSTDLRIPRYCEQCGAKMDKEESK